MVENKYLKQAVAISKIRSYSIWYGLASNSTPWLLFRIKCPKVVFFARQCDDFRPLLQNGPKDFPNSLHECRGQ